MPKKSQINEYSDPGCFTLRAYSLIELAVTSIQLGYACNQIEMNPSKFDQEIDVYLISMMTGKQIVRTVQL